MVTLEERVPKNHLVHKVDAAIDFELIRAEVERLYFKDNGRPPIDPVRLFKMQFVINKKAPEGAFLQEC